MKKLAGVVGEDLADAILKADQSDEAGIYEQRERVAALKQKLHGNASTRSPKLLTADCGSIGQEERLDSRRRRLGV